MNLPGIAVRGSVSALDTHARAVLFDRATSADPVVRERTASIIARVRADGDDALRALAREFDGVVLESLEVPRAAWRDALAALHPALRRALERSVTNIRQVHEAFRPVATETTTADGVIIGRRPDPLGRVGVYAPGGRATYPSSLLMGVVPARVAGVGEVIVCSPPGPGGLPSLVLLAAAELADADRLFVVGGAGAVAAMALGTATIPAVDRIVGPGNAYVAEAKAQVSSVTAIDAPAGPSELLIIADDSASPDVLTRELLAQAEHDPMAAVVLVATSATLLDAVERRLADELPREPRAQVIAAALAARGGMLLAASLAEAAAFANLWAPEHLLLAVRDPDALMPSLRNAGTIFVGTCASVAFRLHDRRQSRAPHRRPSARLVRAFHRRFLPVDDVAAHRARCSGSAGQ